MTRDPDKIAHELSERGAAWADAEAAAQALEETRKSVLAQITVENRPECKSHTEAETQALADARYRDHVAQMVNARKAANKARVRFDTTKVWIELLRSQEATRRAEASIR